MTTPAAIIIGAVIIATSVIGAQIVPRYQLVQGGMNLYRLNTSSGTIDLCSVQFVPGDATGQMSAQCMPSTHP